MEEYGFRWAAISKAMNGTRNEHMVKNRYNSLVKKLKNGEEGNKKDKALWEEELATAIQYIHAKKDKSVPKKTRVTHKLKPQA